MKSARFAGKEPGILNGQLTVPRKTLNKNSGNTPTYRTKTILAT
jgi:hypothetical protein